MSQFAGVSPRTIRAGIIAGMVGGCTIDIFLLAVFVFGFGNPPSAIPMFYQSVAATATGSPADASHASALLGIVLHFCVALGWALAYAWLAQRQPQLVQRPLISGFVFGGVVWLIMLVVLFVNGAIPPQTPAVITTALIAHCIFFGVPVAYVVEAVVRR